MYIGSFLNIHTKGSGKTSCEPPFYYMFRAEWVFRKFRAENILSPFHTIVYSQPVMFLIFCTPLGKCIGGISLPSAHQYFGFLCLFWATLSDTATINIPMQVRHCHLMSPMAVARQRPVTIQGVKRRKTSFEENKGVTLKETCNRDIIVFTRAAL